MHNDNDYSNAYSAGAYAACAALGLEKVAFLPALAVAGRAAMPSLLRAGRALVSGAPGGLARAGKNLTAAGARGARTFAAQAPGTAKALTTAKNIVTHPNAQKAYIGASLLGDLRNVTS